jgi:pimeloyl-ACP methyl ester carboxylesterase
MAFVNATGAKLYVEETGEGYPVIFVHELAADCREWQAQVNWFSRYYRCITFNARGYVPSDVPADRSLYGYDFAVEDIAAVMRGLNIDRAHIVGLSMGAYATLCFGMRYPEKASALVVAGAGSGSPPADRAEFVAHSQATAKAFLEQGAAAVAETLGHSPTRIQLLRKDPRGWRQFMEHLREHHPQGMANTLAMYQASRPSLEDFREDLAKLEVPVLLAVGDEDEPCLQTNLFLKKTIPAAGLWICPNTGHAINLEEPAAFNAAVQSFFADAERGRWPRRTTGARDQL